MAHRQTLAKRVRKATLSRLLPILGAGLATTILLSFGFTNHQVSKSHQGYLDGFAKDYYQVLNALSDQISSLARNDLIINSLIDYSNRESYLPVFFGSLTPPNFIANNPTFSIVFTDFEGKIIAGNHSDRFNEFEGQFDWKTQTLENGKAFVDVSKHGVLIAHPVIYGKTTEGAIALYIKNLSSVLRYETDDFNLVMSDAHNIIFQANDRQSAISNVEALKANAGMKSSTISIPIGNGEGSKQSHGGKSLTITVVQPYLSAYFDAGLVAVGLALILAIILFTTLFSIRLTSTIASDTIDLLRDKIASTRDNPDAFKKIDDTKDESIEIYELRSTFNSVMKELLATTSIKERIEGVIDSLGEMLVVYDLNGEEIMANIAFKELCLDSNKSAEFNSTHIFPQGFIIPEVSASPTILKHECYLTDNIRQISWMRALYTNADGNIIGIVLTGVDLSELIELQKELSLKNQAVDDARIPIIISSATSKGFPITYVNHAFEKQTGYTLDEVKGSNCNFLQGEKTDPDDVKAISSALNEYRPITRTILNYRKDGSEFYNSLSLTPIQGADGKVTHVLGFQADITNQERTQQFLEQARRKAEDSAKLKSAFLASMSHEIRTPMNGLLGMLNLLDSTQLNKEQHQHVRLAKSSADALLVIINDILDFSKIEAGKLELESVNFDMVNLVSEIARSVCCVAEDKQLEIVLDVADANHHTIVGDPGRIRQVLNNLIGNAIKFTVQGYVLISAASSLTADGRCAYEICIQDTGVGIPEDRLDAVFDSFSQVDASTTRKFGGTGLGLTICKQLAELMDGDIQVESEVGKGSKFMFRFLTNISKEKQYEIDLSELQYLSIAHLDSTLPCLTSVKKQLSKWGLHSTQFDDPQQLLTDLNTQHVDILLLSSEMRSLEQNKLCERIRTQSKNPDIKLCILTKLYALPSGTDISSIGVDTYFPKPVTPAALHETLLSLARGSSSNTTPQELCSSDLIDYSGIRSLLVEDNPINQILAVTLLERLGLHVEVANHGKEALAKLKEDTSYKLIFMDCQMPEMDGYETTHHIRSGEYGVGYQDIPIIAMTANAIAGDREKCIDAGMSDYITKPIDPNLLEQRIAHWCKTTGLHLSPKTPTVTAVESDSEPECEPELEDISLSKASPLQADDAATEASINTNLDAEIWHTESALKRTIGREDLLCRVLEAYLQDTPALVERLIDAVDAHNIEDIAYLAHTIKGASLNVSAPLVGELAATIESDAKAGNKEGMKSLVAKLNAESEKLFPLLQSYIKLKSS